MVAVNTVQLVDDFTLDNEHQTSIRHKLKWRNETANTAMDMCLQFIQYVPPVLEFPYGGVHP